jgi:diacylglycerol kinase (ATP)
MSLESSVATESEQSGQRIRVFAVLNPRSGSCSIEDVRESIREHLAGAEVEVHEVTEGDNVRSIVQEAIARGYDPIIAAGGDGTVSTVADALVGTSAHLVIFPLGTANVLARELGIPVELEGACQLSAGHVSPGSLTGRRHAVVEIDAMRIEGHYYFTQVGVGIDSLMIRDTAVEQKRRFGRLAYIRTALTSLIGFQARRFAITIDDRTLIVKASQVLVANTGMMGAPQLRWGPDIRADDGRLDVCIVRARSFFDYFGLFWHVLRGSHKQSPNVRYEVASRSIVIDAKHPLPVQADGEILGLTPVRIEVFPLALKVVVPAPAA